MGLLYSRSTHQTILHNSCTILLHDVHHVGVAWNYSPIPSADPDLPDAAPPCERLIAAVLLRAVRDYIFSATRAFNRCTYKDRDNWLTDKNVTRSAARNAAGWLASNSRHPWGAWWCCEQIGMSLTALRKALASKATWELLEGRRLTYVRKLKPEVIERRAIQALRERRAA